jgi:hypothetical protein
MTSRLTIAGRQTAPSGAMTARALMSMTSKIITDPPGPELARAT